MILQWKFSQTTWLYIMGYYADNTHDSRIKLLTKDSGRSGCGLGGRFTVQNFRKIFTCLHPRRPRGRQWGEGNSKQAEKYGTKKSKERREEPQVFWHQSEARTAATVWNWSGKTLSPGALLAVLYFSSCHIFPPVQNFPRPTICAWVSEDDLFDDRVIFRNFFITSLFFSLHFLT